MSNKILLTDDKFERMLTASNYLSKRITDGATINDVSKSHNIYLNKVYKPFINVASEYVKVNSMNGNSTINESPTIWRFEISPKGQFISDMALHVVIDSVGNGGASSATNPYFRVCAYPGVRMIRNVSIFSGGVKFASYSRDDVVLHNKFFLNSDHLKGFQRCMGQQDLKEATYFTGSFMGSMFYRDGAQTPNTKIEEQHYFIPIDFDFCKDIKNALVAQLIQGSPQEKNYIEIEVAPISEIFQSLLQDPTDPYEFDLINMPKLPMSSVKMSMQLYINNLFINPEICDLINRDVTFSLFRTVIKQTHQIQNQSDRILLNQLKFPVEYILLGGRSVNANMKFNMDQWNLMGYPLPPEQETTNLFTTYTKYNPELDVVELYPATCRRISALSGIIDSIGVSILGTEIYPVTDKLFYTSYLPMRFRQQTEIRTPDDPDAMMIPFCQYPGATDPSGYLNMSITREVYLNYVMNGFATQLLHEGTRFEIIMSASVLNFLIQKNNNYTLKYT